jgi:hypothetical protein
VTPWQDGHGKHHGGKHEKPKVEIEESYRQPLRTREQALAAIEADSAEYAILPFYQAQVGYDTDTINMMSKMFSPLGVFQIEASEHFCLAVYEPQVLDVVHAAHPGSGLTDLLRRQRRSWDGPADRGVDWRGGGSERSESAAQYQAGLNIDKASQMMLRDRVESIFVGPEAARRCKAKLDGYRAAGVKIEETAEWVEPHREMSRRLRDSLDTSRQTLQSFDPLTGKMTINSVGSSAAQTRPLYAVVLPFEVASRSPEFSIVEDNLEDGAPPKKRFLVVEKNYDISLFEEIFRLRAMRVGYWMKRVKSVLDDALERYDDHEGRGARRPELGVRMLVQFSRDSRAASIGDVEAFLRRHGVRYTSFPLTENSVDNPRPKRKFGVHGSSLSPAATVLDIEFDKHHFYERGFLRSIVEGFMWRAFNRSRHGTSRFLAVFPFKDHQLLPQATRRWWNEGLKSWAQTVKENLEAGLGPFFGWFAFLPVKIVVTTLAVTLGFSAHLLGLLMRPAFLAFLAIAAGALFYWRTPVSEIVTPIAARIADVIARLLGA